MVIKKTIAGLEVQTADRSLLCAPPAPAPTRRSRSRSQDEPDPVALTVGDRVQVQDLGAGRGRILAVEPRRNRFSRRAAAPMPGAYAGEQVIVANLDLLAPVFAAADPTPKWGMLDRYLVSAESLDLPVAIILTKLDLALDAGGRLDPALEAPLAEYRRIGYPVYAVSAKTGAGLSELRAALRGRLTTLVGKSGVGKTSLLNALDPGLGLKVKTVSQATGKGRHTTSHLKLFSLANGGGVVDTPGVREFGLWDVDEDDLALFFPEMRPYVGACKFGLDCWHDEEPGCAVRQAALDGHISPERYRSYLRLKVDP